jgi:hypothetical protein
VYNKEPPRYFVMKTYFWTALVISLQTLALDAQILRYQFNEGFGTTAASSGSVPDSLSLRDAFGNPTSGLWGASGSGVSGLPADRALDLNSATGMGSGFVGPNAFLASLSSASSLNQFTITGWFRSSATDLNRANLLMLRNGTNVLSLTGLSGGPIGARDRLRLIIDGGQVDAAGNFESRWSTAGVWAFFAISYNGQSTTDTVRFYSGDVGTASSLSTSSAASSIAFPFGGASLWIGANSSSSDPFKGFIDDIRLYDSVLTASGIEQVRLSAVPEPNSAALLIGGVILRLLRRRMAAVNSTVS